MTEPISKTSGTLEHINPRLLAVETNVRTEASLTKQFIASIQENGVLVPIVAVRGNDGQLWVRAGQRRTLAAREAGLESVPVYVTEADTADTATRLVQQITENDQRLALGSADRVVGIQALLDTGLSVTKVAKRLAVSPERVKQSKAVAGSAVAMDALHGKTATLEEAAGIAEFEDDPDAVNMLIRAASRNYFGQELERLRQQRVYKAEQERHAKAYEELGYQVLTAWPNYGDGHVPLHQLLDAEGNEATEVNVTNANHWSVMLSEEAVFTDAYGKPVDEALIDWATEDSPETEAREGMIHAQSVKESTEWVVSNYFCRDLDGAGLTMTPRYAKMADVSAQLPDGVEPETSADLAQKAREKAERRKVIALNKAGGAAEVARRKFVKTMLSRKTPPKGGMLFVASALVNNGMLLGSHRGDEVAGELLGAPVRTGELLDHGTDSRAEVVLLGMTLGALESLTGKSAWRGPGSENVAYLRFLQENGYGLSPVESVIVGDMSADDCLAELSE